jgi:hypothetical protein
LNTKISRASGTFPDLKITFSAGNFTDPPDHTTSVMYQVSAAGFFKRGFTNYLAVDSHIYTRGYNQTPAGDPNPWYMLGSSPPSGTGIELQFIVCGTGGCSNYIPATYHTETTFTTLNTLRVLKGIFWVKLSGNTDTLSLDSVQVVTTAGGGKPCDPEKDEDCPPKCPSTQCVQCKGKQTLLCKWFGWLPWKPWCHACIAP